MSEVKKVIDSMNFEKVSIILLDVAGTTTAINFVKDTLFPYVTKNIEEFLKKNWDEEDVKKAISQFEEKDLDVTKATELIKTLTEKDDKSVALKTIQGFLYKKGYENGDLKGHIFDDVSKCFENWSKTKKLAIFSNGSIESQTLFFKNTTEGDLTSHIFKYFDQTIGAKTETETYKKIAEELKVSPENIFFLTDDTTEAEMAKSAGILVALVEREGNPSIPEECISTFAVVKSFADIPIENIKRKIDEESIEEPPSKVAKTEETGTSNGETEKTAEIKETENDTKVNEKTEETMEVDVPEPKATETVENSKPEEKPESMEVNSETETKIENKEETEIKEGKTDNEIGTQTKTVTNECETQTTISIKVAEELPAKEIQEKLIDNETKAEPEIESEKKEDKNETKPEENGKTEEKTETKTGNDEKINGNCDKEEMTNGEKVECQDDKILESKIEEKSEEKIEEIKPKENGVETSDKVEEKENKSELANGKENVQKDEVSDVITETKEDEIKGKVIEDKVETAQVSVEA